MTQTMTRAPPNSDMTSGMFAGLNLLASFYELVQLELVIRLEQATIVYHVAIVTT